MPPDAPSGAIRNNAMISVGGTVRERSAAIRMHEANRVTIEGNREIGETWFGGREFSFGIADGFVLADGIITAGKSKLVTISNNGAIRGGTYWSNDNPCEGSRAAAAIFLAGTGDGTIVADNGWLAEQYPGVRGGGTMIHWNETDRLPPSAPGIWTVNTRGVVFENNRVVSGNLASNTTCPPPSEPPVNVAFRDGLPPQLGETVGTDPSETLWLKRNSVVCDVMPQGSGGSPLMTICAALELNHAQSLRIENNILANVFGNVNIGLWVRGSGPDVLIRHNTINPDLNTWAPIAPYSIRKYGIVLDDIEPGLVLANNLIYLQRDDPADIPTERLGLWERSTNSGSAIDVMASNLFYLEDDDLATPMVPNYLRLDDADGRTELAADQIDAFPGVGTSSGNLVARPGLNDPGKSKWELRINDPASDAIDACDPTYSLVEDIDNDTRPQGAGCDIGSDEWVE